MKKEYLLEMVNEEGYTVKKSNSERDFPDFCNEAEENDYMLFENGEMIDLGVKYVHLGKI